MQEGGRTHSLSEQRKRVWPDHYGTVNSPRPGQPVLDHVPLWGDRFKVRTQEHPFIWAVLTLGAPTAICYSMPAKMRVVGTGPAHLLSFSPSGRLVHMDPYYPSLFSPEGLQKPGLYCRYNK